MTTRWLLPLLMVMAPASLSAQTETSTTVKMPEEGGPLPRAPMPTGGVDDGKKRAGKLGGVDHGDMNRVGKVGSAKVGQHCHEHDHGGEAHSHCHEHKFGPKHEHAHAEDEHCHEHEHDGGEVHSHCHQEGQHHEDEHCHEHEHDGSTHTHCHKEGAHHAAEPGCETHSHDGEEHSHCDEGTDHHAAPEEHCHEHAHDDGEVHSHCHQEEGDPKHGHPHVILKQDGEPALLGVRLDNGLVITWDGFLRVVAEVVENDPRSTFIGRNDGFKLGQARLGTMVKWQDLFAYISLEAAVGVAEAFNDPNQEFAVRPRDAFLRYDFSKFAGVQVGRFKTPYDYGFVKSSSRRIFIDAPLETNGVLATLGNEVRGMSQDRQIGVMINKDRIGLSEDGFDVGYALALTNGRVFNNALNDNDRPAGFARLMLHYGDWATFNLAGFTDSRTVGELPNLFDEDVLGGELSLLASFFGLTLEVQFLVQRTRFETTDRPDVTAYGVHAQWDYRLWDFRFGYRFGWYEPNTNDLDDADQVQEHTIAVLYTRDGFPLQVGMAGTVALEQEGRQVDNNRITLLSQFRF